MQIYINGDKAHFTKYGASKWLGSSPVSFAALEVLSQHT